MAFAQSRAQASASACTCIHAINITCSRVGRARSTPARIPRCKMDTFDRRAWPARVVMNLQLAGKVIRGGVAVAFTQSIPQASASACVHAHANNTAARQPGREARAYIVQGLMKRCAAVLREVRFVSLSPRAILSGAVIRGGVAAAFITEHRRRCRACVCTYVCH